MIQNFVLLFSFFLAAIILIDFFIITNRRVFYAERGGISASDSTVWYCDDVFLNMMHRYISNPGNLRADLVDPPPEQATNISFLLFTRQNPSVGQRLERNESSFNRTFFNSSNPTRVIVHGFCNCQHSDFCTRVKDVLLQKDDFNIVTIDWSDAMGLFDYIVVRLRIFEVASRLASFLDYLHTVGSVNLSELELIGHSLGAHLAGLAGKRVTGGRVGAIVALDPAGPLFSSTNPKGRIASTDAEYVEVIHTNGGVLGMLEPLGDADFYPNGGKQQPGCLPWLLGISCSHGRAWELYAESIGSPVGFWATTCDSLEQATGGAQCRSDLPRVRMAGDPLATNRTGLFSLPTNGNSPFAMGNTGD